MSTSATHSTRSVLITVADVIRETNDANSLVFDIPAESAARFAYKPGQFLTLRIPSDRTGSVARCYSLASSPHTDTALKVTVKRTLGGYASNWICDNVRAGDTIEVLPPSGQFTPKTLGGDFLLLAAGSGITPVMAIAKSLLAEASGKVTLVYANRDEHNVIFAAELRALQARNPGRFTVVHWLESVQGLPAANLLATLLAPWSGRETYMCGPGPFMDAVHQAFDKLRAPRSRIHTEVFNSLAGDPFTDTSPAELTVAEQADSATVEVELDGEVHALTWPRKQTLVDIMLAAGIDVPYSCQEGECGSCACTVVSGEVEMDHCDILDPEDIESGYVLGCQAHPVTDRVTIQF